MSFLQRDKESSSDFSRFREFITSSSSEDEAGPLLCALCLGVRLFVP